MEQADVVFSGKVATNASYRKLSINLRFPFIHFIRWPPPRIEFSVKEVWKGKASSEIGIINTLGSSCNFNFKEGEEYMVYAYRGEEGLYTNNCSRTALLIDASEDLTALGTGIRPELPSMKSSLPAIGSLFLALALPVLIMWIYCLNRGGQLRE